MSKKPTGRAASNGHASKRRPRPKTLDWRAFDPLKVRGDEVLLGELTTYRDHLDELLKRKGDFVLIKGCKIVGIFEDRERAVEKAVELFRDAPVLIKRIVASEPIHSLGGVIL